MAKPPVGHHPERIGHFDVVRRLGVGGMAEVFLAKRCGAENIYKLLVVKRILPAYTASSRFRTMFAEEANLATRLNHPNIVQVYEFQDYGDEGQVLSMEYVEGIDLGKLMAGARARGAVVPPWVAGYVVAEAAKGLHYAHEKKDESGVPLEIVHRDVSPQNILLSYEGAAKLADFGVATASMFRDEVGVLKGKFGYMSPEQARGERVDRRSDIYALGVILHELLTGRPLRSGLSGDDLLAAVRTGLIEPPSHSMPDVPPALEAVVMRALQPRREDRYQTARDLAGAVARAMLQFQVLVDSTTIEATIATLAVRESDAPIDGVTPPLSGLSDSAGALGSQHTVAARRPVRSSAPDSSSGSVRVSYYPDGGTKLAREVRHVAVVSVRLHGLGALRRIADSSLAAKIEHEIREMFDQLAFKRSARFTWDADDHPRAIVGLAADPSRSASDAAFLAVDVDEFLADASGDWPAPILASTGIVRAVASGRRDRQGHLVQHKVQPPAEALAELLSKQAPVSATWVAGGVHRLVRNDFLWADAPPLQLDDSFAENIPRMMRLHELVRPLTREERNARREASTSDLIGRDTEKADLHSAFHQATQRTEDGAPGQAIARVVLGELGIGKSALVEAFLLELEVDTTTLRIDCSPAHVDFPFWCVAAFVRGLTGTSAEQTHEEAQAVILGSIGAAIPGAPAIAFRLAELASGKQVEDCDEQDASFLRKMLISGVLQLVTTACEKVPLVLIVDGLQWADQQSLDILAEVFKERRPAPVLALLLTRPDDRVAPFIEQFVRVELRGLRSDEQLRLVASRLGVQDGVASACADLVPRVGGNPFFFNLYFTLFPAFNAFEIFYYFLSAKIIMFRNSFFNLMR